MIFIVQCTIHNVRDFGGFQQKLSFGTKTLYTVDSCDCLLMVKTQTQWNPYHVDAL